MTGTARHVCHDYKIKCPISHLLSDTRFNVTIASAYIGDRLDDFGDSYVLGLGRLQRRAWAGPSMDPRKW